MNSLTVTGTVFYTQTDERLFFEWLQLITIVESFDGEGRDLFIRLRNERISDADLWEFIGLFTRYRADLSQLSQFLHEGNQGWFKKPEMFWHNAVFEGQ